jgi:hypothetical protein
MFEWYSLVVYYDPYNGTYRVADINYCIELGYVSLKEGPGWIFDPRNTAFFDSGNLGALCELLMELNSTIEME